MAPPRSDSSIRVCMRTSRPRRFLSAAASFVSCGAAISRAAMTSTSTTFSTSARSASNCAAMYGSSARRRFSASAFRKLRPPSPPALPDNPPRRSTSSSPVTCGLPISRATPASAAPCAAAPSSFDQPARSFAPCACANAARAYGLAMVARSAMRRRLLLELRGQLVEELGVRLRVHLAAEHLGGSCERECRDILAERVAGARLLVRGLAVSRRHYALALGDGQVLGLAHQLVRALVGDVNDLHGLLPGFRQDRLRAVPRVGQFLLALLARGDAVGDFLAARLDDVHQHGPDEFHAEPDEDDHRDRLPDQCQVEVHRTSPSVAISPRPSPAAARSEEP